MEEVLYNIEIHKDESKYLGRIYSDIDGVKEFKKAEFQFEESLYQEILEVWENRGERLEGAVAKEYPDPFK